MMGAVGAKRKDAVEGRPVAAAPSAVAACMAGMGKPPKVMCGTAAAAVRAAVAWRWAALRRVVAGQAA